MTEGRIEGSDIEWTYDPDTGKLTLTGSGPMPDFLTVREEKRWYSEALYKEYYEDYGYEVEVDVFDWTETPWNGLPVSSIEIGEGITSVGKGSFCAFKDLEDITPPETLESIGAYAFGWSKNLIAVSLPGSLGELDRYAFHGCDNLERVEAKCFTEMPEGYLVSSQVTRNKFGDTKKMRDRPLPKVKIVCLAEW